MSDPGHITTQPGPGGTPGLGPPAPVESNPNVTHEPRDANVRALFAIGAGLFVVTAIICLAVWGVFDLMEDRAERRRTDFPLAAEQNARPLAQRIESVPAPILEGLYQREKPSDRPDVRPSNLRPGQHPELGGYWWVEGQKGRVAQIPIDAAMREVLRRKEFQPAAAAGTQGADKWRGLQTPAQPNSGRGAPKE
jgi:hypothetical protein